MNEIKKQKKHILHSMVEFDEKYLPNSYKKTRRISQKPQDAYALGISLAEESLNKIGKQLSK